MSSAADIVVVGAGPTGLTLACELHRHGVPCRVLDQSAGPTTASRALGMFTRSLEVLDDFGAAEEAIARGHRIEATNLYSNGQRIGGFKSASIPGTRYPVILALPQYETEALLERRLEELGGSVERGVRVTGVRQAPGGRVQLSLEGPGAPQLLEADWVVGADGAHSVVRKQLGVEFAGRATRDVFVIVDAFVDDPPARHEGHYYFSPDGMMVVIPLPDGSYRFAATMPDFAPGGEQLELDFVQALLDRRVGRSIRIRDLRDAGWGIAQVRVHTRIAEGFRNGRCLLAGDAAHIYSPVGGQGMNGGIQDAQNLAWKLRLVATGHAPESLLDSYAHERGAVARQAQRATAAQTRMATLGNPLARGVRDGLARRLSKAGALDRRMAPQVVQLNVAYRRGGAVAPGGRRGPAGRRIADLPLERAGGSGLTVFELLREHPFALLVLTAGRSEPAEIDELARTAAERYGGLVSVTTVVRDGGPAPRADEVNDPAGALHGHLGAGTPSLCLVRPDAHVAFFGPLSRRAQLLEHLDGVLRRSAAAPAEREVARQAS